MNIHLSRLAVDMTFTSICISISTDFPWIPISIDAYSVYKKDMYPLNIHKAQLISSILTIAISISIAYLVSK